MKKDNVSLKFYGSNWVALLPFVVFIASLLIFASNRLGSSQPTLMGLTLLSIGLLSFLAKDTELYWKTLVKGMTKPSVAMFTLIFTLVGIFATLLNSGGIAGGIIWLASVAHIKGIFFIGFTFIAAAILSTGSGSSMATVLTLGPALYPAGVILGANPFVLAGALISGANFGDTLAPVSDVTIVFDSRETSNYGMDSDNPDLYGARAAATLANYFLKRRDSVQLVIYSDKVTTIKKGSGQKQLYCVTFVNRLITFFVYFLLRILKNSNQLR